MYLFSIDFENEFNRLGGLMNSIVDLGRLGFRTCHGKISKAIRTKISSKRQGFRFSNFRAFQLCTDILFFVRVQISNFRLFGFYTLIFSSSRTEVPFNGGSMLMCHAHAIPNGRRPTVLEFVLKLL